MKTPQITPKLEADAHEIRWICTTGCPKETYGNFVLNRKNLELRSATEKFKCEVGYSGHEVGLAVSYAAAALGISSLERHITLDRSIYGSDQSASIEPQGLNNLV